MNELVNDVLDILKPLPAMVHPLTDEEVMDFAKKVYRHELFVSWSLDRRTPLHLVFPVLTFMNDRQRRQLGRSKAHFVYSDMRERGNGPVAVNGYPICFGPTGFWSKEDGMRVHAKYEEIRKTLGDVK